MGSFGPSDEMKCVVVIGPPGLGSFGKDPPSKLEITNSEIGPLSVITSGINIRKLEKVFELKN